VNANPITFRMNNMSTILSAAIPGYASIAYVRQIAPPLPIPNPIKAVPTPAEITQLDPLYAPRPYIRRPAEFRIAGTMSSQRRNSGSIIPLFWRERRRIYQSERGPPQHMPNMPPTKAAIFVSPTRWEVSTG
jgi:hypothetical protein